MGMRPTSIKWCAPKYVSDHDQYWYNHKHNWRGIWFRTLGSTKYWLEYNGNRPAEGKVWKPGTEVYDSISNYNATIIDVKGGNTRDSYLVFHIKLHDGTVVERCSKYLDIAF